MFLNLFRWRFQKNKFVLLSMCVRRRHIEREHAVILNHSLEFYHSSNCCNTGCCKHRRITCVREVLDPYIVTSPCVVHPPSVH